MNSIKLLLGAVLLLFTANFQSIAQTSNFNVKDMDGNTVDLYEILNDGKAAIFDVSAVWCGPCWSFHQSGDFKYIHNTYGPEGTNQVRVFLLEIEKNSDDDCIKGQSTSGCNNVGGDWYTGTPYSIINDVNNAALGPLVQALGVSSIGMPACWYVCPDKKAYDFGNVYNLRNNMSQIVSKCNLSTSFVNSFKNESNISFQAFPNPSNGQLTLNLNSKSLTTANIKIFDLSGQEVWFNTIELEVGQNDVPCNLQHLNSGSYTVQIASETNVAIQKISIIK